MNEFGQMALLHWKTHLPDRYREIPNPEEHFAAMGVEAQERATRIEDEVFQALPTSQDYLRTMAMRNQARAIAREMVLEDLLPAPSEASDPSLSDPLDQWVDAEGMPLDRTHPLWAALDDEAISPSEFQRLRTSWVNSLPIH